MPEERDKVLRSSKSSPKGAPSTAMKIATLQFTPTLGDVAASIAHAERLLHKDESKLEGLDLLVLPELAFTGYNFPTLAAITPHLEPTASGRSTAWAIKTAGRLKCTVAVGYPERTLDSQHIYNALVFASASGAIVAHTRKSHLYYSDEIWAEEGPEGFFAGEMWFGGGEDAGARCKLTRGGEGVKVAAGICMDINPYQFTAPWTAYEFTRYAREAKAKLIVLSCAWLTHIGAEDLSLMARQPDLGTVGYWVERFSPMVGPAVGDGEEVEVVLVIANRTGEEGIAERVGEVRYAGSSCVMGLRKGERSGVEIWDILGRAEEGVLVVDTEKEPRFRLGTRKSAGNGDGEGENDSTDDSNCSNVA